MNINYLIQNLMNSTYYRWFDESFNHFSQKNEENLSLIRQNYIRKKKNLISPESNLTVRKKNGNNSRFIKFKY